MPTNKIQKTKHTKQTTTKKRQQQKKYVETSNSKTLKI